MSRNPNSCPWSAAGCPNATRRALRQQPATRNHRHRLAFTLTEILVVVAIIVLILAMAIPAFNFITGSRSLEAAQNNISAMLGRARAQALYTGQPAGVAIYDDARTRQFVMALVQFTPSVSDDATNIDLVPDQDPQSLQPGTAARGMIGQGNYATPAVVLFDGEGRLVNTKYTLSGTLATSYYSVATPVPVTTTNSQLALILFDRSAYDNNIAGDANWLDANGQLLVINRYNGTLLRSE